MKKFLLPAIAVIMFASCSKTLNDRAGALIKEDMKSTLVNPKSYDAIETKTDSAFAPMDDPMLYSMMLDIAGANITISDAESTIAELNENMVNAENAKKKALSEKPEGYMKDCEKFDKIYSTCKTEIANVESIRDSVNNLIGEKIDNIKKRIELKSEFIGYKSIHIYSAENYDKKEMKDSCFYLFDKDMTKVVLSLPLKQYRSLSNTLSIIRDEVSLMKQDSVI